MLQLLCQHQVMIKKPLPSFTAVVKQSLRQEDSSRIWMMVINKLVNCYSTFYSDCMRYSSDYKLVGRAIYKMYLKNSYKEL